MNNQKNSQEYGVKIVLFLYRYLMSNNYDGSILLDGSGLDVSVFNNTERTMSREQINKIVNNIITMTHDPLIGLKMGKEFEIGNFGTLGYAVLCAKTVGESLNILLSLHSLIASMFEMDTETNGEEFSIKLLSPSNLIDDVFIYYCDFEIASIVFAEGQYDENREALTVIRLMHSQGHLKRQYEDFFGCSVEFNQPCNEIVFKQKYLNEPMPRADIQTSQLCFQQCEKILAEMTRKSSLIERVRKVILSKAGHFPTILDVSEQLGTSQRTLSRKLKEEGTSFQEIFNDVRFQLAKDYLATHLPIEQIAELVGYSEPANFSHAFKRWASLSPKEYRQTLK